MSLPSGRARRRWRTVAGFVAVAVLAYGAGLVTGVVGSTPPASSTEAGPLDEAAAQIAERAATPIARAKLDEAAVDGMLGALGDRWSAYYGPQEFTSFSDSLEGSYTGVGMWVTERGGALVVSSVPSSSPAAAAGVRAGDVLAAVDGSPTRGASVAAVAAMLRGGPGSRAVLVLVRDGVVRTVDVTRGTVTTHDVTVERLKGGVTVIRVAAFSRGVGEQVQSAVEALPHGSGVVLDLRGDPGGLLTEAVDVASAFLDGGPVVSLQRRGAATTVLDAGRSGNTTVPLVVLVDSSTASAAEVVTAALQDRNRAVVVGTRTFGKGSVQEPTRLSDGSAIELTVGRYLTPDGTSIDGVGIEPDVVVPASATPAEAEQRALEVLSGLSAVTGTSGRG